MRARELEPTDCIECLMAWLLYGDGALCLLCQREIYWNGAARAALAGREETG